MDIKENTNYLESDLEKNIIEHLKEFLLELGKGFSYIENQAKYGVMGDLFKGIFSSPELKLDKK